MTRSYGVTWVVLLSSALFIAEGCAGHSWARPADAGIAEADQRVSRSGVLNAVWNGEPRFILLDDEGHAVRLMIDDALLKSLGGVQALVQKRVTVAGRRVSQTPEVIEVLSIEIAGGNK
jgi:hypothetical protein